MNNKKHLEVYFHDKFLVQSLNNKRYSSATG